MIYLQANSLSYHFTTLLVIGRKRSLMMSIQESMVKREMTGSATAALESALIARTKFLPTMLKCLIPSAIG